MKTKHGNCSNCALIDSKKYSDTSFVSNNNNISELDYLVVCDFQKDGESIIDMFKDKLPSAKYGICDRFLCDRTGFKYLDLNECTCNCANNVLAIRAKCKPKKCFIVNLSYPDNFQKDYGFVNVKNVEELMSLICGEEKSDFDKKEYFSIKIPEKYYTGDYRLVNIQYISNQDRLIYTFRTRDNKKEFYEFPNYQNNFYWYEAVTSNKIIDEFDKLKLVTGKYKDRNRSIRAYYGDVDIEMQHSVDYFMNNKEEAPVSRYNIMFFDIETYQYLDKVFPDPDDAKFPITAISFRTDDPSDSVHVYMLNLKDQIDPRISEFKDKFPYITLFDDERTMLRAFFQKLYKSSIDFLAGWNVRGFDIPYIVKRMSVLKIDPKELSPFGCVYADKSGRNMITGYHVMDQMKLFKDFIQQTQPSYSLNAIASSVLGKEKVQHEESIDEMYHSNIEKFMRYSQTDTQLIYEIEQEEQHISLQDTIRAVATTSQSGADSTIGCADGLYATDLKKRGLVSRNYTYDVPEEKFPGAYVYDSLGGLFIGLLCDFDYTSLYPTIIRTWNIGNDSYIAKIDESVARAYVFDRATLKGKKFKIMLDPIHAKKIVEFNLQMFEAFVNKYHANINITGTIFCGQDIYTAVNVEILTMLMNSRKVYKKKMLNAKEAGNSQQTLEFNNKQLAFKVLANSLYGVLGAKFWRFYCPDLGKSITLTGQEMLKYAASRITDYMYGRINEQNHPFDIRFESKISDVRYVLYGDTDSCFVNLTDYLKNKGISLNDKEKAIAEINKIQSFYNDIALPQLLQMHNIDLKYSVMNLKNEFLFSRYYTLVGSKHYCSHVISQEGKNVDYLDVKGLEIKRSEIPPASQRLLQKLIDTIMDDKVKKYELKDKLDVIVKEGKKEMLKMIEDHNGEVARVVSFSKPLDEYKTIPAHIKGMLMWNDLTGVEDFKHGVKGKMWNILGINIEKAPENIKKRYYDVFTKKYNSSDVKCICVPEDVDILPDYFQVDVKKMISYGCDDRVNILLDPLWKESENDSDLLF